MFNAKLPDGEIVSLDWLMGGDTDAQKHLELCHLTAERVACLCHGNRDQNPPLLYVKRFGGTFSLARMPHTEDMHVDRCKFSRHYERNQSDHPKERQEQAYNELASGESHVNLDFQLNRTVNSVDVKPDEDAKNNKPRQQPNKASILGLLEFLWEKSNNNRYFQGKPRSWARSAWFLDQKIQEGSILINKEPINEYAFVARWDKDEVARKQAFWRWYESLGDEAETGKAGILIGKIRSAKEEDFDYSLKIDNLPITLCFALYLTKNFKCSFERELNLINDQNYNEIGVFLVSKGKRNGKQCLIVSKAAILSCDDACIPVESSYELQMSKALRAAERSFIKPIKLHGQKFLADFVLVDQKPATFVEVWGMGTDQYLARKQEKLASYKKLGKTVICWDAFDGQEMPDFSIIN